MLQDELFHMRLNSKRMGDTATRLPRGYRVALYLSLKTRVITGTALQPAAQEGPPKGLRRWGHLHYLNQACPLWSCRRQREGEQACQQQGSHR
jgi:hypothetical protein